MGAVSGDFPRLAALERAFGAAAAPAFRREVAAAQAKAALAQVRAGFRSGRDPEGNPWAPLTSRAGRPLVKTRGLMNSVEVRPRGDGFALASDHPGAAVHQHGHTVRPRGARFLRFVVHGRTVFARRAVVPRRRFLPDGDRVGPAFATALVEAASGALRRLFR